MPWRLFDTLNGQWYDDDLYTTREACIAAGSVYMREAQALGADLQLVAEWIDPTEPFEGIAEEEAPSC